MYFRKHIIMMVLGCAVPLLLLFFELALGVKSGLSFFVAIFGFTFYFLCTIAILTIKLNQAIMEKISWFRFI